MEKEKTDNAQMSKVKTVIKTLAILFLLSWIVSSVISAFYGEDAATIDFDANVAVIPIKGVILTGEADFLAETEIAVSDDIIEFIEDADEQDNIKAIIFEIDSPGGSPVASEEIANAIKKTNKTTVAWIREAGASGAYWAASATDHIVASRMSITGSIGVIASYLEYTGLLEEFNLTYQRFVSGPYKDLGDPFKELSKEERGLYQAKLDKLHDYFVEAVADNRGIPKKDVQLMATGMFYLGSEAKELGLVDEMGSKDEAIEYIERKLGIEAELTEYEKELTLADIFRKFSNQNSFYVGKGIGSSLKDTKPAVLSLWT